ncbi:hypothetical protein ACWD0Z_18760 [Streptomyces sp. NPDC003007]
MAATGDDDPSNPRHACHVHRQGRDMPVRLTAAGTDRLLLVPARPGA